MMVVDSNVWAGFFNGVVTPHVGRLDEALRAGEDLAVLPIVVTEVLQGFRSDNGFRRACEVLTKLPVVVPDLGCHVRAAELFRRLRQRGVTVRGAIDCVIAIDGVPVTDPDDGGVLGYRSETYDCTSTRFTVTDTPEKIVMFSPDREILWPGGLLQGKSHRDGLGSLLPLSIRARTPIKVSIPSLATADNFRLVTDPDQASVTQAIGSMIYNATTDNLVTPSTIQMPAETAGYGVIDNQLGIAMPSPPCARGPIWREGSDESREADAAT